MAVATIGDVVKHAEAFERLLADYYAHLARDTTREGVRLLTDYMSRHRVRIEQALAKLSPDRVAWVNSVPLRYEPQAADCRCFAGAELPPDATAEQVLDEAVVFDECLVRLYRQVLQQEVPEEVREVFEAFVAWEQSDEVQLKKIKAAHYF